MANQLDDLTQAFQGRAIGRRKFLYGMLALGVSMPAAVAILEACGGGTTTTTSKASLVVESAGINVITTLDPALAFLIVDQVLVYNMYQSLLRVNTADLTKPYPSIATSYTTSSDGKTYTFPLNKAAVFSDGTPVTAADAAFSLNRNVNVHGTGQVLPDDLVATAVDQHTVAVTVQTADQAIPWYIAHSCSGILNSAIVMQNGGTDATDASTKDTAAAYLLQHSAGSGPYVLESTNIPSTVSVKVNPHYWGTKPVYQRVIFSQAAVSTQVIDLEKGTAQAAIDVAGSQLSGLPTSLNVARGLGPNIQYLGMSNDPKLSTLTSNPGFREAVRYGIDYDGLVKIAYPSVRVAGYIPSDYLGALPLSEAPVRDVTRAKAALANAGLTNPTINLGFVTDESIGGLDQTTIASKIQADLKEVGINIVLAGLPGAVFTPLYHSHKVAFLLTYDGIDFPDPTAVLHYVPGGHDAARLNYQVGQEPAIDALVATAQSAVGDQQRAAAYQALQRALTGTNAYVTLYQLPRVVVASKSVQNLKVDSFRYLTLGDLS